MSSPTLKQWHPTDKLRPPEGKVVLTIAPGGQEVLLKRVGLLWFDPEGTMYQYFEPVFWAEYEAS